MAAQYRDSLLQLQFPGKLLLLLLLSIKEIGGLRTSTHLVPLPSRDVVTV